MINNGSIRYNNDADGIDTQLGGAEAGCEVKIRNKEHDTQLLIRYVGDTLTVILNKRIIFLAGVLRYPFQVFQDTDNVGRWKQCFKVPGVHLPTGYYLGLSAATGDLSGKKS